MLAYREQGKRLKSTYSLTPIEYKIGIGCILDVSARRCRGPPNLFVPFVFRDHIHFILCKVSNSAISLEVWREVYEKEGRLTGLASLPLGS